MNASQSLVGTIDWVILLLKLLIIISRFSLPVISNKQVSICESCKLSKSHNLPFNSRHEKSSSPLELIYTYLWGPSHVISRQGYR